MKRLSIVTTLTVVAFFAAYAQENCATQPKASQEGACPLCSFFSCGTGATPFCQSGSDVGCVAVGPSQAFTVTSGNYICNNGVCGAVLQNPTVTIIYTTPKGNNPSCVGD
jgi:hypothetical protein